MDREQMERVLYFVQDYIFCNNKAPSLMEISAGVGRSHMSAKRMLTRLHEAGRLTRGPGHRNLHLTQEALALARPTITQPVLKPDITKPIGPAPISKPIK